MTSGLVYVNVRQFKTFAILTAEPHGEDTRDSEGDEVIQNRARRPWLAANVCDVVNGESSFDGSFLPRWIDLEVTIEAKVSDDRNAEFTVA